MRRGDVEVNVCPMDGVKAFVWCCRGGLNSRPRPYQGRALPLSYDSILTALMHPYQGFKRVKFRHLRVSITPNDVKYLHFKTTGLISRCHESRIWHTNGGYIG